MMKMQVYAVLLFIALVFVIGLHAVPMDIDDDLEAFKRDDIDPQCTLDCGKWWVCRVRSFFLKKCSKPEDCNCGEFAWEG
ncbi:hypothetical protein I4U23_029088 [Adineta vaga]|nr:hypothetical protein I4U23_029088 [Adineta vaga]